MTCVRLLPERPNTTVVHYYRALLPRTAAVYHYRATQLLFSVLLSFCHAVLQHRFTTMQYCRAVLPAPIAPDRPMHSHAARPYIGVLWRDF